MEPRVVGSSEAWSWVEKGSLLFGLQPLTWIVLVLIWVLAVSVPRYLVPFLGLEPALLLGFISLLIGPGLYGGAVYGASELDQGRRLRLRHLFRGFTGRGTILSLLILGLITIGIYILLLTIAIVLVVGPTYALTGWLPQTLFDISKGVMVAAVLVGSVFFAMALMTSIYAAPLVIFTRVKAFAALKSSFTVCVENWVPMLVFGLIVLVCALAVFILLLFVGYAASKVVLSFKSIGFLFIPFMGFVSFALASPLIAVTCCAIYASYKSVYERG